MSEAHGRGTNPIRALLGSDLDVWSDDDLDAEDFGRAKPVPRPVPKNLLAKTQQLPQSAGSQEVPADKSSSAHPASVDATSSSALQNTSTSSFTSDLNEFLIPTDPSWLIPSRDVTINEYKVVGTLFEPPHI